MKGLRVEIVVRREGAPVEEAIAQPRRRCCDSVGTSRARIRRSPYPVEGASSSILGDPAASVFVVGAGFARKRPESPPNGLGAFGRPNRSGSRPFVAPGWERAARSGQFVPREPRDHVRAGAPRITVPASTFARRPRRTHARLTSPPHRHGPRHAARRYRRDRARPRRGRPAPRGRGPAVRIPKHRPPPRPLAFTDPSPGTPDGSAWQGISCPLAHPSPPFKSPADGLQRICPRRARRPWSRRQLLRGLSRLDDAPAAPSTADHRDSPPRQPSASRVLVCPESRAHVRRRTRALAYSAPDAPLRRDPRDPRDPPSPSGSTLDDARHSPARDSGGSRKWT